MELLPLATIPILVFYWWHIRRMQAEWQAKNLADALRAADRMDSAGTPIGVSGGPGGGPGYVVENSSWTARVRDRANP